MASQLCDAIYLKMLFLCLESSSLWMKTSSFFKTQLECCLSGEDLLITLTATTPE